MTRWHDVRLADHCEIVSGATPRRDHPEYWGGDIAWVTPKDLRGLDGPVIEDTPEKITKAGYKSCSTRLLPMGSVLFSSRAPIGLVAITGREMCTNQGFKSLIPGADVDAGYLYWCLKRQVPRIASRSSGTTFSEISRKGMERIKIPLPPLPEQRRIAAILDKADAIRRKRQQTLDLADQFLRSAFLDMFGDPITNPKGWPVVSIGKLAGNSKGAIVIGPFGSDLKVSDYRPEGHPVIFVRDIQDGTFVWDSQVFVDDAKFEQLRAHRVVPGDVLATKMGAPPAVAAVYPSEMPVGIITADIIRIRPDVSIARPTYLAAAINSPYIRAQVRRITEGVTRPKITLRSFRQLSIPVPPLELQGKWEQLIRAIERLLCKGSSAADRTHTLFNALAQRAFRGELLGPSRGQP